MEVRIRYRNPLSFWKFLRKFSLVFMAAAIGIMVAAMDGEEDFLFLLNSAKTSGGEWLEKFGITLPGTNDDGTQVKVIKTVITKGEPNLSLIDQIQDNTPKKGYIKELLSLCRDAHNGKLHPSGEKAPMQVTLGIWNTELGTESGQMPKFYFTPDHWKKDDKDYSFIGHTSNSKQDRELDSSDGKSIMKFVYSKSDWKMKSKVDPKGNSRGSGYGKGDWKFLPDALAYIGERCKQGAEVVGKDADQSYKGIAGAISNNRGQNGCKQLLTGQAYRNSSGGLVNVDEKKLTPKLVQSIMSDVIEPFDTFNSNGSAKGVAEMYNDWGLAGAMVAIVHSAKSSQWFINQECYNHAIQYHYVDAYKKLYPDENKTDAQIKDALKKHIASSVAASINKVHPDANATSSKTAKLYNTSSDYQDCYYYQHNNLDGWGYAWFVSDTKNTSGLLKNGSEKDYLVSGFDGVDFAYIFNVRSRGNAIYGWLLKEAGVNSVDPTKPDTYLAQTTTVVYTTVVAQKSTTTQQKQNSTPAWTGTVDLNSAYKKCNIDESKLSEGRIAVLKVAATIANHPNVHYDYDHPWEGKMCGPKYADYEGSKYSSCTSKRWGIECSGFSWYCYKIAGYEFPNSLAGAQKAMNNKYLKTISLKDARPGDLLTWDKHVEIYLSGDSPGHFSTVGAHGHSGNNCDDSVSIEPSYTGHRSSSPTVKRSQTVDSKTSNLKMDEIKYLDQK